MIGRRGLALALAVALAAPPALAQSVTGTHGLLSIPTARMHADGTLVTGTGYVDQSFSTYQNGTSDYAPIYASLTFLPSVEVGFRFSRALNSGRPEALGDRMFLLRVRLLEEGQVLPAIAVGAHDFFRSSQNATSFFNALYAVGSKRFALLGPLVVSEVDLHAGWGTDALEASGHQFVGPFGGIALSLIKNEAGALRRLDVLAEYDGRTVSVGPRIDVVGLVLTAGIQGLEAPIGSLALRTQL